MLLLRTVFALGKLTKQVDMIERLLLHHLEAEK
jgi:hypothetical protein